MRYEEFYFEYSFLNRSRCKKSVVGCLLWLAALCVFAETPVATINNLDAPFDLNPYVETIEDPNHEFTLNDIQTGKYDHLWRRNTARYFIGKNIKSKYWFRLTLTWQGQQELLTVLYIDTQPNLLHHLLVVLPNVHGASRMVTTGALKPYSSRDIAGSRYGFKLSLNVNKPQTVIGWVNNATAGSSALLPFFIVSEANYGQIQYQIGFILVAFYAVMTALWLYNFCLYVMLREPMYGLYILFLASGVIISSVVDGSSFRLLWAETPILNLHVPNNMGVIMSLFYLSFVVSALNGATFWPRFKFVYRIFIGMGSIVLMHNWLSSDFNRVSIVLQLYSGLIFLVNLVLIISAVRMKQPTARYLLIAEMVAISGGTGFVLMLHGIVPMNMLTSWGLHWAYVCEALLLSLALAARTRIAQQSAIQHLQNYESLYQNSIEGHFQYLPKSGTAKCNHAMATLCGYDSADAFIADNRITQLTDEETKSRLGELLLAKGTVTDFEAQITHQQTQKPVWVSVNMRLVKDNQGQPDYVEASVVDISERKLKEQAEFNRAAAEYKNAAKSQFFASISHELRTPLTAILGYSETAMPLDVSIHQKQSALEIIHRSGNHLLQIINDILDLSKVEAQKLDVEQIQVYLLALMDEVRDTLTILARQKNLFFTVHYHYPLPKIFTSDPTRIKQVLLNLCGNAIKFTETGGVSVDVSCSKKSQTVSFTIKDTGFGLKPDQVDNLFGAFTQADASTTRNYGGTGLGLYLSKQLAQKLGGDISVASVYGEGSTFTLTVATADLDNVEWLDGSHAEHSTTTVPKLSGSVLYAEDNRDNWALVKTIIEKTGATVTMVSNGKEALDACANHLFNLVFTDIRMPRIDGVELTKALLAMNATLPVIAVSATSCDQNKAEFKGVGFKKMLRKPIDQKAIYEILIEYLPSHTENGSKSTNKSPTKNAETKTLRVLLAEDNMDNQDLIQILLKRAGAEVLIANDGFEAIANALNDDVDLILMDMQMPNMDGLTAVNYLRGKGFIKPIYALTANETAESIQECKDAGCDGHLSKPLDTGRLTSLINEIAKQYVN